MERQAGTYTVDAVFAGLTNLGNELYVEKMLDPLRPKLILPDVVDSSKWKVGKLWFMDPEGVYILRLYNYISAAGLYINTQYVKPEDFKTIKEIVNPKWRGKISVYDPTVSGTGLMDAARYQTEFGDEFVRRLYVDQKPVISRNKRQLADWLGRGTYPISLGVETEAVINMKKQGLPVEVLAVADAPATLSAGNGLLGLMNRAPNPNAAKIFVNWIASKEGLELLARARNKPQTRVDIDESYALPWEVPQPGVKYFDTYNWDFQFEVLPKVTENMKNLLKK
jgi:iron(III) transport system substrate-binding protein